MVYIMESYILFPKGTKKSAESACVRDLCPTHTHIHVLAMKVQHLYPIL